MSPILEIKNLVKRFRGLTAVNDVSFAVQPREIFGVIGPNGAGKTTLFNTIAGYFPPSSGQVLLQGRNIAGKSSDQIARLGIGRTFQAVHNFSSHSVRENLRRAEVIRRCHSPVSYARNQALPPIADIDEVADFIGLTPLLDMRAGDMAYGQQKILGVGLALMVRPTIVLMDEPAAGLNSSEKREMGALIQKLRSQRGLSVLLVEHDMPLVMEACDRIQVVAQGAHVAIGTPAQIKSDAKVIDAYLGENYEFA